MTWGLMIVTALALDAAGWTNGLRSLVVVSVFSVGFGFLLARSHYSELVALMLSSVYCLAVVLVTNAILQVDHGTLWQRTDVLLGQVGAWLNQATAGEQPDNDSVAFVLFLSVLFWFLGHNAAWHVFRVDRVWRVIAPTGMILLTNQFYYQGDAPLDRYLVMFVILALLLLIRSHIEAREYDWFLRRVSFPGHVRRTFIQAGGLLAVVLVIAAWRAPTGQDDKSLEHIRDLLSGEKLTQLAELWNRLFSSLEGQGIATADYYGGDELQLGGAIQLGDQPVMYVSAPYGPRYYWRSTVYDSYDFSAWRWRHIRTVRAYTDEPGLTFNIGETFPGVRTTVTQTFTLLIRATRLVYTAPQPVELDIPIEAELDCVEDFQRTCVNENGQSDVAVIRSREALRTGDSYTAVSSISTATGAMLRGADTAYPDWVQRLYLQGANQVSARIRDLAADIVSRAGAQTPYDKAKAIELWLRTNIQYNESIPTPPRGVDPIEWFLFDRREGYCNYYATAMVLMLRSQGVPARMAAGFAQGTWDPERGAFLVRERDAHTWVEVYFPGYGWTEFEPTADEAPIQRQDDPLPQTVLPTVTPPPTPTPLPSPTQTGAQPTEEGGANATPTGVSGESFLPSTPTPSPSPAPTATPAPPPDATRVGGDQGSRVLRIALLTLGIFALLALTVGLIIAFTIWYVEYRGLGGLNVIERAYARVGIYSRWVGVHFATSATPEERRRFLSGELPEVDRPVTTITQTYTESRYASPERAVQQTEDGQRVKTAWHTARWIFISRKVKQFFRRE